MLTPACISLSLSLSFLLPLFLPCLSLQIFSGEHPPSLAQGMPQFTFACFCGLHGFCKMKRKKEEVHRQRETAV